MARIAVDVDDTLYSFTNLAKKLLANWDGTEEEVRLAKNTAYSPWVNWRSMSDLCPFYDKVIAKTHEPEQILANEPFEGAVDVLNELVEAGHSITYITNRVPEAYDATLEWLINSGFPTPALTELICTTADKLQFIEGHQYIIDDRPKTLVTFVYENQWYSFHPTKARMGFGLMTQANQSLTDIPGVYLSPTWDLLRKYFSEKANLL